MQRIIQKDMKGDFKPFALLSNGHFSDKTKIEFFHKKLDILNHTNNHLYSRRTTYISVKDFKVKKKRASLTFSYKGEIFEVSFRNRDNNWEICSFQAI